MSIPRQITWSQDRKAEKKCPSCGKPALDFVLCNACHFKQVERMRQRAA